MRGSLNLALGAVFCTSVIADFAIIEPGLIANSSDVTLSDACVAAMQATIRCEQYFQYTVSLDVHGYNDPSFLDMICTANCATDLASYHSSVVSSCASDPYPWDGTPPQHYGDQVWASYNMTCLKSSGVYCQNYFANITLTEDTSPVDLPTDIACSPCMLALGQLNQATAYSNYDDSMAVVWANLQSKCGVSYPTAVTPIAVNMTSIQGFAPTGYPIAPCLGSTYTVVSGDNCGAIAASKSVPRGTLQSMNDIIPDCSNLQIGQVLCIPAACTLYTIQSGDTCNSISNSTGLSKTQLLAWNPFINSLCTNLIAGDGLCVTIPGETWNGTTIAGATGTKTAVYATATVTPPGSVAFGTTTKCGKYYQVKTGDYCEIIAVNNTITIALFEAINPSVNSGCTNLDVDLYYCVEPTADWNTTDSTTTTQSFVTAPAPTPSGTTPDCYEYYTVVSGDYCAKIESAYNITMDQLVLWNPNLLTDCSNLQLGDAYCVDGATGSTSTTSYATPPAPTPTGTTSSCYEFYTIVSGDYCGKVEEAYGITMAQLQLWNPSLLDDCSNLQLGDAYCVDGDSPAARKRAADKLRAVAARATLGNNAVTARAKIANALPTVVGRHYMGGS